MARKLRNGLFALVVLSGVLWLVLEASARSAARDLASLVSPVATLEYQGAGIASNGRLRLDSPRLRFGAGEDAATFRADSVYIAGKGWLWTLLDAVFDRGGLSRRASIEAHGLQLSGLPIATAAAQWLQPPGLVPFASLGCTGAAPEVSDYARRGVRFEQRVDRLEYWFYPDESRLELDFDLDQPGVSRLSGSAQLRAFGRAVFSDPAARRELRLERGEFDYRDTGFLAQRNALCANRIGKSTSTFIDAHVSAVDAFLAAHGIKTSDTMHALYRSLVSNGGTLRLATLPDPDWMPSAIGEYPRADLLRQLSMTVRLDDALPVMLQLAFDDPSAPFSLPDAGIGESSVVASTNAPAEPVVATSPVIAQSVAEAPAPTAGAAPLISDAQASQPAQPSPLQPTPPPAVATTIRAPIPDARPPSPVTMDEGFAASAPPPPENSTLALVWKPGVIERLPPRAAERPDYEVVALGSLGSYGGRRVRLVTAGGKVVDGDLQRIDSGQALMLVRTASGSAQIAVPLTNVREVRLVVGTRR